MTAQCQEHVYTRDASTFRLPRGSGAAWPADPIHRRRQDISRPFGRTAPCVRVCGVAARYMARPPADQLGPAGSAPGRGRPEGWASARRRCLSIVVDLSDTRAPHVHMAVARVRGRRGRQDPVEGVAALRRDAAGARVVDLVQEFEAFQALGPEGVEGSGGERPQRPGRHPSPAGVGRRPVADLRGRHARRDLLDRDVARQSRWRPVGSSLQDGEGEADARRPLPLLGPHPRQAVVLAVDRGQETAAEFGIPVRGDQGGNVLRTRGEGGGRERSGSKPPRA